MFGNLPAREGGEGRKQLIAQRGKDGIFYYNLL